MASAQSEWEYQPPGWKFPTSATIFDEEAIVDKDVL